MRRTAAGSALLAVLVLAGACTGSGAHGTAVRSGSPAPTPSGGAHNVVASLFARALRFPTVTRGCPVSATRLLRVKWGGVTGGITGYAVGRKPALLVLAAESVPIPRATVDGHLLVHRAVTHFGPSNQPGWGALKTVWLAYPGYPGPFIVRGRRLDGNGSVAIGDDPAQRHFVVQPGPSINAGNGYRPGIGYVWLKKPGCYGFQLDGTTFSRVVVVYVLPPPRGT